MCWVRAAVFTKALKSLDGCLCTELQVIRSGQMDLSQFGIDPSKCKTWYSFIHSSRGNLSSYRRKHGQNRLVCRQQIAACGGFGRKWRQQNQWFWGIQAVRISTSNHLSGLGQFLSFFAIGCAHSLVVSFLSFACRQFHCCRFLGGDWRASQYGQIRKWKRTKAKSWYHGWRPIAFQYNSWIPWDSGKERDAIFSHTLWADQNTTLEEASAVIVSRYLAAVPG